MVAASTEIDVSVMVQRARRTQRRPSKRPMIVALARKLLVALWKYVNSGVVIEGAIMRVA